MSLFPRLYDVSVKHKSALISLDTCHPSGDKTILWWAMVRAENGPIVYMTQPALNPMDEHLTGSAETIEEALAHLMEYTVDHYGPVESRGEDYVFGLEFI